MTTMLPEKPPAMAMKESLDVITEMLTAVIQHQQAQAATGDTGRLITDACTTMQEGIGALHNELMEVTHALQILQAPPVSVPPSWRARLVPWVGGSVAGCVLFGALWWSAPPTRTERFAGALDTVLVEHYAGLPKGIQERLTALYKEYQYEGPGTRQKGAR